VGRLWRGGCPTRSFPPTAPVEPSADTRHRRCGMIAIAVDWAFAAISSVIVLAFIIAERVTRP